MDTLDQFNTLDYLLVREQQTAAHPFCLNNHPDLAWNMRAILLDWMMEVAAEFKFKRETFHLSANYVDIYLSRTSNVGKGILQLVGAAALWMAAKFEEIYPPKVSAFVKATDYTFNISHLNEMERSMLMLLGWELAIPTINVWANICITYWDDFCKTQLKTGLALKVPNQRSYHKYRELMQILDAAVLDLETLNFGKREIALSGTYVILSCHSEAPINDLFACFLEECFRLPFEEIVGAINYIGSYAKMPFSYMVPTRVAGVSLMCENKIR